MSYVKCVSVVYIRAQEMVVYIKMAQREKKKKSEREKIVPYQKE